MVTSTSRSDYHGATFQLKRNFQQGFLLQGAYTFGRAMNDADIAVGATAFQDAADIGAEWAVAGYDVAPQAVARRIVGAAVLQEQLEGDTGDRSAAGRSRGPQSSRADRR